MIGIIVAVVVVAVVLVPICNSIADNSGGSVNTGEYYYDIPDETYLIWIEGDADDKTITMEIRPMSMSMTQEINITKSWTFNLPFYTYLPIAVDDSGQMEVWIQIVYLYEGDMYLCMIMNGVSTNVNLQDSDAGGFVVTADGVESFIYAHNNMEYYQYKSGEYYVINDRSDGEYVCAKNPKVLEDTDIIVMGGQVVGKEQYEVGGTWYIVSTEYYYIGSASGLSDGMEQHFYGDESEYTSTITSFITDLGDGVLKLGPISYTLEKPGDVNDVSYESPIDFYAVVPMDIEGIGSDGGGSIIGTIVKVIPIFVILGILIGMVAMYYQGRNGL